MKLASAQETFSLCSVHNSDKFRIFLRLGLSSLSTLDSSVRDRGDSVMSRVSDREDTVDESAP